MTAFLNFDELNSQSYRAWDRVSTGLPPLVCAHGGSEGIGHLGLSEAQPEPGLFEISGCHLFFVSDTFQCEREPFLNRNILLRGILECIVQCFFRFVSVIIGAYNFNQLGIRLRFHFVIVCGGYEIRHLSLLCGLTAGLFYLRTVYVIHVQLSREKVLKILISI